MTMADVVLRTNPDYPQLQTFHCSSLRCDISPSACAANYTRTDPPISCKGCPIGSAHAGGLNHRNETDRHTKADAARALACIRCEKSAHTNKRLIGRMRLVRSATLCVSCLNRQLEVEKGANSKGAMPRLVLKPASVTIEKDGVRCKLDIGLRMNWHECARYVERIHADATVIKIVFDGETVQQYSLWTPLPFSPWEPGMVRDEKPSKPKRTYTNRSTRIASKKTSAAASPVDWDDWDTPLYKVRMPVESDESDADSSRQARRCGWLRPMSEEDDAAYRVSFNEPALEPESIAAFWDGMNADGLPEFVQWLCEDWPTLKRAPRMEAERRRQGNPEPRPVRSPSWLRSVRISEEAARGRRAPATAADAAASPEVVDPAVSDSERTERESEWAGCYLVRDGMTTHVCDYVKERGISDEEAAIVLGMCDPDYTDEPEAAATLEPEPEPAPEPAKAEPAPKKLTGKQLRKLEKAERRAERQQGEPQPTPNRMPAKQTAIAARAYALLHAGK
ncbi:hypothetical protein [Paraburkholderia kirstenboschensis]|uniref:hypothetical protein n=1 Tax=Paraburkholderia kirstenboschensis TaxID=1245436 RepID=UPI00191B1D44|nr:hypothetical protein [Paraburkholderia kirstenboschensis]